jgi:hypothetical protein
MEMLVIAVVAIVAFAAVLLPLFRRANNGLADEREFDTGALQQHADDAAAARVDAPGRGGPTSDSNASDARPDASADRIEREVLRYREALRAGTLCGRCGAANPPGSAYCADCGKRLPLADAREFA